MPGTPKPTGNKLVESSMFLSNNESVLSAHADTVTSSLFQK